ncbi:HAD family phosphatase [uncultured Parvibaculum sp.]|uniref:HAD family hydrolase n=1 Tax=uncultured Parvibaculum sp. TaxID=291828 RepID=UPI0030D77559|tara:strand:- start:18909 stop:19577 length:669 start_codon:yes stop_codon:yes gene_type:complete
MALSVSPSLVIFDCDGVLVDTEPVANRLLVRVLAEDGFDISYEECRRLFVGRTMESVMAHVEAAIGRPLGDHWPAHIRDETLKAFASGVSAVSGVQEVLRLLADRSIPCCVASSGKFEKMRFTLGRTGLLPLVEGVLFSAEQVAHGKPAPDLFLHAAASMGHVPETCLVIEDSVPGVRAAVAAGMPVLGYAGDPHTDAAALECAGARVFDDMSALPGLIGLG